VDTSTPKKGLLEVFLEWQPRKKQAIIANCAKNNQGGVGTNGGEQEATGIIEIDIRNGEGMKMTTEGAKRVTDIIPDSPRKKNALNKQMTH